MKNADVTQEFMYNALNDLFVKFALAKAREKGVTDTFVHEVVSTVSNDINSASLKISKSFMRELKSICKKI